MEKKDNLTKGLAISGTVLAWLPLLAPVVLSGILFLALVVVAVGGALLCRDLWRPSYSP